MAIADQQSVSCIDPDNVCEFVSLVGNYWRPEDQCRSETWPEPQVDIRNYTNAADSLDSGIPVCVLYPWAFQCEWQFAEADAAAAKYRSILAELQACVDRSDMWEESELHPETCTMRVLMNRAQAYERLNSIEYPDTHLFTRLVDGTILHHHGSDEAISLSLHLVTTSTMGGFNPNPTQNFSTTVRIDWEKNDDIEPEVCAEFRNQTLQNGPNPVEQYRKQTDRPTSDTDSDIKQPINRGEPNGNE